VQEEEPARDVQRHAPRQAGVGRGTAAGAGAAVPAEAAAGVLGERAEQVAVLHVLGDQHRLALLQAGAHKPAHVVQD